MLKLFKSNSTLECVFEKGMKAVASIETLGLAEQPFF